MFELWHISLLFFITGGLILFLAERGWKSGQVFGGIKRTKDMKEIPEYDLVRLSGQWIGGIMLIIFGIIFLFF